MPLILLTGTMPSAGVAIPQPDLSPYGVTAPEFTDDQIGMSRAILALLKGMQNYPFNGAIGISKPANSGFTAAGNGLINRSFSLTSQSLVNTVQNTAAPVPLPTVGNNAGLGAISLTNVFLNASILAAAAAISDPVLVFLLSELVEFDSSITAYTLSPSSDDRKLLTAMYKALASNTDLRSPTIASAFTAKSVSNYSSIAVPAAYIAVSNPTSGIDLTLVSSNKVALLNQTYSLTIQTIEDDSSDSYDVNVVVS